MQNELFKVQQHESNKIGQEARAVYKPTNTTVTVQFLSDRLDSWQAHLEDISCYLVQGEGKWWKGTDQGRVSVFLTQKINNV